MVMPPLVMCRQIGAGASTLLAWLRPSVTELADYLVRSASAVPGFPNRFD
jgi:hypothetical protein